MIMHIFPSIPEGDFEAYIFDCDGTLANSMDMHYKCWKHVLELHKCNINYSWDTFRSHGGMSVDEMIDLLNKKHKVNINVAAMLADISAYVHKYHHLIEANHEVVEYARQVSKTFPTSVASGGPRNVVHKTLKSLEIYDLFHHIVTQEDVKRCKPAPDLFLLAAEKMGVSPKNCLVFEDSITGIEAAKKAGMHHVLVDDSKKNML